MIETTGEEWEVAGPLGCSLCRASRSAADGARSRRREDRGRDRERKVA